MKQISILFLLVFMAFGSLSAQEVLNAPNPLTEFRGNSSVDPMDVSGLPERQTYSPRALQLIEQINQLRKTDNPIFRSQVEDLNRQLSAETGNESVVEHTTNFEVMPAPENTPEVSDLIGNVRVGLAPSNGGLATFTEQNTATAGKIWTALGIKNAGNDSLKLYYSTNNGTTWVLYALANLGTNNLQFDMMDCEVIGNTTGQVYVYVSYSFLDASSNERVGLMVIQAPTFAGSIITLAWPGAANTSYYDLRITSDNFEYPGIAYLYLACSIDSVAGATRIATQKTARITNPYQSTITMSYRNERFWWNSTMPFKQRLYTDIAYFQNSSDSIIISFSGVQDSTSLFFAKGDISGSAGNAAGAGGFIKGTETTAEKEWGRMSSNGNDNGSVVIVYNLTVPSSNRNVKYLRTTNYGNFNSIAGQSVLWGSTGGSHYQPDIMGKRGSVVHAFTFNTIAASDSVHYVSLTSTGATSHIQRMNHASVLVSGTQGSKPSFRNVVGDSCFAVYAETGPSDIWAAYGCSGTITGIQNNTTPSEYTLLQNYPNPFNPSTSIQYSLPVKGLVKLTIYDVSGKEVAILVNDIKEAGSHLVDFNASELPSGAYFYKITSGTFTAVKKMMLIK